MAFARTYWIPEIRSPIHYQESDMDPSLVSFLEAPDETDAEHRLGQLIAESIPTIRKIVRDKLRVSLDPDDGSPDNQDALEVVSDVQAQLFAVLQRLKNSDKEEAISDFQGYLAVVTYHTCYQHLRRKHPERWRLKNRLRYLFNHRQNLRIWKTDEGFLCSLALNAQTRSIVRSTPTNQISEEVPDSILGKVRSQNPAPGPLCELITFILERADAPVALDDLVSIIARLCGIERHATASDKSDDPIDFQSAQLVDSRVDLANALEQRIHLERLWKEINQLPLRHRAAILLNLRDTDGRGVITLLPITRVATIRQIAEALEFSLEEFARVWSELPWDDAKIAQHLGLTRQQVINLRHSARSRLARRSIGY